MADSFESLKKNTDFRNVYRKNVSKVNRYFVVLVKKNDLGTNRIGISVSKKIGNSVVRHRVTRVVREVFRLNWNQIEPGHDIVVVARSAAKESSYAVFENAILSLLKSHHLINVKQEQ